MGPTAAGKSAMALDFADSCGGEIVSVDSMQLYRGLEIGTAQPTAAEKKHIPHHLVGILDISERIDVFSYCEMADQVISDIAARGKIPVLAGGTGFYFKSLFYGLDNLPGDRDLRQELDELYDNSEGEKALKVKLSDLDPDALEKFSSSRRKMIRALEVKLLSGRSILELQQQKPQTLRYDVEAFYLEIALDVLRKKIAARAAYMLENGWIEEAEKAIANGLLKSPTAWQAIGYNHIHSFCLGEISRSELLEKIITSTCQYARRQRTWFRHQHPEAKVITPSDL